MNLRFALLNVQGLISKRINKLKSKEVSTIFQNNDVVLFTEVWSSEIQDLSVDGFECFPLHRTTCKPNAKRNSGGIAIYIRNELVTNDILFHVSEDDIIWLRISGSKVNLQYDLFIGLTYIIPELSSRQSMVDISTFDRLTDSIVKINNLTNERCNIILAGDFNSRTSDNADFVVFDSDANIHVLPDDYVSDQFLPRVSQDKGHLNSNGTYLLDFCKQTGLRILNGRIGKDAGIGKYTFVGSRGSSLVDYVLTNEELFTLFPHFQVEEPNLLSDHCLIQFELKTDAIKTGGQYESGKSTQTTKLQSKVVWDIDQKDQYINSLSSEDIYSRLNDVTRSVESCINSNEIDNAVSSLINVLDGVISPLFKKNLTSRQNAVCFNNKKQNPWFNRDCEEKKQTFLANLNIFRDNKTNNNRINLVKSRSDYKCIIRKCKYNYDKQNTLKLEQNRFKNAKLYWNMLKESCGIKTSQIDITTFENYFKAINNPNDHFFSPDEDVLYFNDRYLNNEFEVMFEELNSDITIHEVSAAIKQLKSGRSSGPDLLLNEFFIHGERILAPILLSLFNKCFNISYFPEAWSDGYVVPLHKKGSINNHENYRGITLLSTVGKLFTRILNNRLKEWAESYNVYIEAQAGFRTHMGTTDNIFVLHGLITHMINSGKKLFCGFVDFTKAFDYVVRENLWTKLIKLGLRGKILDIIRSMYNSIKSKVKFLNELSDEFSCNLGVRQGECLSPFLFSMYLNDLEEEFMLKGFDGIDVNMIKMLILLYADDIVIFSETAEGLQKGFDILLQYCGRWKLKVNTNKTKVMVFRKAGPIARDLQFLYDNTNIEIVTSFTYLGIVFTPGGSFNEAQHTLAGQAQKAIFKLNKYLYKFTAITVKHKLDLFDKLVSPILNYSAEVWGFIPALNIERVHTQFLKKVLNVKVTTQNDFVYGELGRKQLIVSRHFTIIKYWLKIIYSSDNKYVKQIYKMMLNDMILYPNKTNWAKLVNGLLSTLGFNDVWLQQGVGNTDLFLTELKLRLNDNFTQNWNSRLDNSTRASFYRNICGDSFGFKYYLNCVNISKYRHAMTRLRVSSHRLEVEAGRWHKPVSTPFNERKCRVCDNIEDEYHFMVECQLYQELREKYINKYYWRRPNMLKLTQLFLSENERVLKNLSLYIYKAFEIRNVNF